jgi:hypothetical protein
MATVVVAGAVQVALQVLLVVVHAPKVWLLVPPGQE